MGGCCVEEGFQVVGALLGIDHDPQLGELDRHRRAGCVVLDPLDGALVFLGGGLGLGEMMDGFAQQVKAYIDAGPVEGLCCGPGLIEPAACNVPVHDGAGQPVARGNGFKLLVLCDVQEQSVRHCTS
jgi:hypothetical protein